ncbi:aspartate ammonia-lyase [Clostridium sp. BJN0013]|uniref:aspartate ammonia-lyase n=1 Tax=Clostridium sp. BJN0013 TaxID=3236840 RepID=UPI0034C69DB3
MGFRIENDSIGAKKVPKDAYYGVQTLRGAENFKITGLNIKKVFIESLAQVKKAAAQTNNEAGILSDNIKNCIVEACDEIISGNMLEEFITDPVQGGAGTSINMNANEVIANRALEILGYEKGNYNIINPNDHVNMCQSTNDVIPTTGKITTYKMMIKCIEQLENLYKELNLKAVEFYDVIKIGRTQMQDAVPIRLGQEFNAYSEVIKRDINRLKKIKESLLIINLGGTAVGTGINTDKRYFFRVVPNLAVITGLNLIQAKNLIDATQNLDCFVETSSVIKTCAVNLSKIANDLRFMSSGPRAGLNEINLPSVQNGSSIMPGKVNPVIPEVINQIAFNIVGNDVTITMAAEAGQLELNPFQPIIFFKLFQSIETLTNGIKTFVDNCIRGITVNKARCKQLVDNSVGIVTAISPYVGYKTAAKIAKIAINTGESISRVILENGILNRSDLSNVLNPIKMTEPGIMVKLANNK